MVANLVMFSVCLLSVIYSGRTSPTKFKDIIVVDSSSSEDGIRNYFKILTKNTNQYKRAICKTDEHSKDLARSLRLSKCRPIDTIVKLDKRISAQIIVPNSFMVKRCGDCGCYGNEKCLPTKTRMVRHAVKYATHLKKQCEWLDIEEHVDCKCGCDLTPVSCHPKQIFDREDCSCSCTNVDEKVLCDIQGKIWNETDCSCQCKERKHCSTGAVWNSATCSCMIKQR